MTTEQDMTTAGGHNMTTEHSKQVVLRLFSEVFNQQSISVIDELYAPNVVDHTAFPEQPPGVEGIKAAIAEFFEAFDLEIAVEDVVAEDSKVVTREVWGATNKESGKKVEGMIIHIFYVNNGKITDEWSLGWDWLENL